MWFVVEVCYVFGWQARGDDDDKEVDVSQVTRITIKEWY